MNTYYSSQIFKSIFIIIPLMLFLTAVHVFQWGENPIPFEAWLGIEVLWAFILLLFFNLQTTIDQDFIELKFGIGLIKFKFPIEKIATTRIVENPWYYGWGIRLIPRGMLYNASGKKAVELRFKNKRRIVRIGTQEPNLLKEAIDQRLIVS